MNAEHGRGSLRYRVRHRTVYEYGEPVSLCHNEARLTPRRWAAQDVLGHEIVIDPAPALQSRRQDFFGNDVLYFTIQEYHSRLVVSASTEVEVMGEAAPPAEDSVDVTWETAALRTRAETRPEALDARQYLLDSPMVTGTPEIAAYATISFPAGRPLREALSDLIARIHGDVAYEPGTTTIATPPSEVLAQRRGVCQDFTHLAIACLRSLGLAARYVSGYIETAPPHGRPRLIGADASHAWLAAYHPDLGWLHFDPTNNQVPRHRHITTAWGRDYSDVTPIKGIIFGGGEKHTAAVAVDVERLAPGPTDTAPA